MSCILLFNFILLLISLTLLLVGLSTSKWLILTDENGSINERAIGIVESCQRLYRQGNTDQYSITNNSTINDNTDIDAQLCFNRLLKWHNPSSFGPELLDYQKVLIGVSFACVFVAVIALLFTQFTTTSASFHNVRLSKRLVECLLITNILSVLLALITVGLFLGFERLQTITAYGYSFWSFVSGACCMFICCILTAVYRIDVEFEFRRYRQDSVATLC